MLFLGCGKGGTLAGWCLCMLWEGSQLLLADVFVFCGKGSNSFWLMLKGTDVPRGTTLPCLVLFSCVSLLSIGMSPKIFYDCKLDSCLGLVSLYKWKLNTGIMIIMYMYCNGISTMPAQPHHIYIYSFLLMIYIYKWIKLNFIEDLPNPITSIPHSSI